MKRILLFTVLAQLACMILLPVAQAHPHVFVDCFVEAEFNAQGLVGFRQTWMFDEMFTQLMLEDFDTDGNGQLSAKESANLEAEVFVLMADYGYLTEVRVEGEHVPMTTAKEFKASVRQGKLTYTFLSPCPVPVVGQHTVTIAVYDEEYYADMYLDEESVSSKGGEQFQVDFSVAAAKGIVYWEVIVPNEMTIHFSK